MPTTVLTERRLYASPTTKIDWFETLRRHGWPPNRFVGQTRRRSLAEVPVTALVWLSSELNQLLAQVDPPPLQQNTIITRLTTLDNLVNYHFPDITPVRPDRSELRALAASGHPWRDVATAAAFIDRAYRDPEFLAFDLLEPVLEEDLQWRLFHVAVFGLAVAALRRNGHRITWLSPLGSAHVGPQIATCSTDDMRWDLWFEAGAARSYYSLGVSTYHELVQPLSDVARNLAPDVLLFGPHGRALILECKWSPDLRYVARDGYHQTSSYALDALNQLASEVWAFTVGPDGLIPTVSVALGAWDDLSIVLGLAPAASLDRIVHAFLRDDRHFCDTSEIPLSD